MTYLHVALANNLTHFEELVADGVSAETLGILNTQRRQIYKTVSKGLSTTSLAERTARLIIQLYPLPDRNNYLAEWVSLLERARITVQANPQLFCILSNQQIYTLLRLQKIAKAGELLQEIEPIACDAFQKALSAMYRAQWLFCKKQYRQSEILLTQTLKIFETFGGNRAMQKIGAIYTGFASIYKQTGRFERQREAAQKALNANLQINDLAYAGNAWGWFADAELKLGNYVSALHALDKVEELLGQTGWHHLIQLTHHKRAMAYFWLQDWETAEAMLQQIDFPYLEERGEWELQGLYYQAYGGILCRTHRYAEAIAPLRLAIDFWIRHEKTAWQTLSENYLAEALLFTGNSAEGSTLWKQSLNKLPNYPEEPDTERRLKYVQAHLFIEPKAFTNVQ